MQKSGKDHSLLLVLPSGVYRYRFVVDGERKCLPDLPCETDAMGNAVNLLDVNVRILSFLIFSFSFSFYFLLFLSSLFAPRT
jgi:hypothetical protein